MNGEGLVIARYDYDHYGRPHQAYHSGRIDPRTGEPIAFDFLFTGHLYHSRSGLHFAPFRAYDPTLGRWISKDPIDIAGGINLHEYVHGNPIIFRDMWGWSADSEDTNSGGQFKNPLGKLWNCPNTLVGMAFGGLNVVFGGNGPKWNSESQALEFTGAPMMLDGSAITLGNTIVYEDDSPSDSLRDHEAQHVEQGELLGPLYLPANIGGGVLSSGLHPFIGEPGSSPWHGPANPMEIGPQADPPRPWPWPRRGGGRRK